MIAAARPALALLLVALAACAPRLEERAVRGEPALGAAAITAGDGHRLPLRVWPAAEGPRAVVLALHGVNDYGNAFAAPAAWWAARGIATYAYDQRGFGAGAGARTVAGHGGDGRGCARGRARRRRPPSRGAALPARRQHGAARCCWRPTRGRRWPASPATSWPAPRCAAAPPCRCRTASPCGSAPAPCRRTRLGGGGLGIVPSDNVEMLRALGRDPLVIGRTRIDALHGLVDLMDEALAAAPATRTPTLVLYGARDEIIPRDATLRMLAGLAAPHRVARYAAGLPHAAARPSGRARVARHRRLDRRPPPRPCRPAPRSSRRGREGGGERRRPSPLRHPRGSGGSRAVTPDPIRVV